jgi:ribosomal protein S18 acetylase RimI-like enzyme
MSTAAVSPTYRPAGPEDVDAVVALVQSAYRGESSRAGWTTEADLLDGERTDAPTVAAVIADPRSRVVLAEVAGALVACCHLRDDRGSAYFGMFAVRPGVQGGGIGRAMVTEAERYGIAAWGAREMWMTVIAQRADLIAWYERLGFARTGETRPFPYGDERFGVPKRPDLEFVVLAKSLA